MAKAGRSSADEALALEIAKGQTLRAAAEAAGLGERTAQRRWADRAFRRRVNELRGDLLERTVGKLTELGGLATEQLAKLLKHKKPAVQLAAVGLVLRYALAGMNGVVFRRRVEALVDKLAPLAANPKAYPLADEDEAA